MGMYDLGQMSALVIVQQIGVFCFVLSLKKTSTVLDEHEEALRKKLEMVSLERQTQL